MAFNKSFPRTLEGSTYPRWEEVYLDSAEENKAESLARSDNVNLMKECIKDAKQIISSENLKDYQTDVINLAISLFEKRASHVVFYKEQIAKEKFDKQNL
jgi:hypothetical protein